MDVVDEEGVRGDVGVAGRGGLVVLISRILLLNTWELFMFSSGWWGGGW